jgi:hypothetical protein
MRPVPLTLAVAAVFIQFGCGNSGEPSPGHADPCATPMAGVLGCPATDSPAPPFTLYDACAKLVDCGILAAEFLGRRTSGEPCQRSADCDRGQCIASGDDSFCYEPFLDYEWCVGRMSSLPSDPCGGRFTVQEMEVAVECIASIECPALGLPFGVKRDGDARRDTDRYVCENDDRVLTATVCDNGILHY